MLCTAATVTWVLYYANLYSLGPWGNATTRAQACYADARMCELMADAANASFMLAKSSRWAFCTQQMLAPPVKVKPQNWKGPVKTA